MRNRMQKPLLSVLVRLGEIRPNDNLKDFSQPKGPLGNLKVCGPSIFLALGC